MTDSNDDPLPILSPTPLLVKAGHFAARIGALGENASPAEVEKCARAMSELYKTSTLMQNFNAQEAQRNETANYDNFPAPSPEQEADLREKLLGYYDRIYAEQAESGGAAEPSDGQRAEGVLGDVATDSP